MKGVAGLFGFLKEVKSEMRKVVWPTFPDFMGATVIVLVVMVAFSIYLGSVDYLFYKFVFEKVLSI